MKLREKKLWALTTLSQVPYELLALVIRKKNYILIENELYFNFFFYRNKTRASTI